MDTCQLIVAGYLAEEIQTHKLDLTEKGKEALTNDATKAVLLQVASTCLMGDGCACPYRDTPALINTNS